jgi:hypothetical protein
MPLAGRIGDGNEVRSSRFYTRLSLVLNRLGLDILHGGRPDPLLSCSARQRSWLAAVPITSMIAGGSVIPLA